MQSVLPLIIITIMANDIIMPYQVPDSLLSSDMGDFIEFS